MQFAFENFLQSNWPRSGDFGRIGSEALRPHPTNRLGHRLCTDCPLITPPYSCMYYAEIVCVPGIIRQAQTFVSRVFVCASSTQALKVLPYLHGLCFSSLTYQ